MKSIKNLANTLDKYLSKVMPASKAPTATPTASTTTVRAKTKPKGFFKKTFRNDNRLALEAYVSASSDAEQQASLSNIKTSM